MFSEKKWLLEEKYGGEKSEDFFTDLERLKAGEPLGYVIGYVPFLDTKIFLDSKPLIPRVETEFWVEKVIESIKGAGPTAPRLLDLCAGSGAIGVAVAKAIPKSHITFGEVDSTHLPTIAKNLKENDIDCTRYQVFQSDLFANITGQFDFILCNPPYINESLNREDESVKNFEPHLALYGGKDGLELIENIVNESFSFLADDGELWLEHEPEQTKAIHKLASRNKYAVTTHKDQYGVERYSILQKMWKLICGKI